MRRFRELDWLWLFLLSWIAPVIYDEYVGLQYWSSLLFWLVPIGVLAPRYLHVTDAGGRRRRAFVIAVGAITILGLVLDFGFGHRILRFDDPNVRYLARLPALSGSTIPIEEVLFYALGPIAILLVYVWCDEYWLSAYNPGQLRIVRARDTRLRISLPALAWGGALVAGGTLIKWALTHQLGWPPQYFTFLVAVAIIPAIGLFSAVSGLVNWRAFGVTTLYLVMTAALWEAVLALPRHWWGYQPPAMMGLWVKTLSPRDDWWLPVEAVIVWICTPFSVVMIYEAVKRHLYAATPDKPIYQPYG